MVSIHSDVGQLQALLSHIGGLRFPFIKSGKERQARSAGTADPEIERVVGCKKKECFFRIDQFG